MPHQSACKELTQPATQQHQGHSLAAYKWWFMKNSHRGTRISEHHIIHWIYHFNSALIFPTGYNKKIKITYILTCCSFLWCEHKEARICPHINITMLCFNTSRLWQLPIYADSVWSTKLHYQLAIQFCAEKGYICVCLRGSLLRYQGWQLIPANHPSIRAEWHSSAVLIITTAQIQFSLETDEPIVAHQPAQKSSLLSVSYAEETCKLLILNM